MLPHVVYYLYHLFADVKLDKIVNFPENVCHFDNILYLSLCKTCSVIRKKKSPVFSQYNCMQMISAEWMFILIFYSFTSVPVIMQIYSQWDYLELCWWEMHLSINLGLINQK